MIRGLYVQVGDPVAILSQSADDIANHLVGVVQGPGLGAHWTDPSNRGVAESFASTTKGRSGIPVILHAQFRRDDQRRSYKPKGFWLLEEFVQENEVSFSSGEVLRLKAVEWWDGTRWVEQRLPDLKSKV